MEGAAVCRVAASQHPDFAEGDWILAYTGWQDHTLSDGTDLTTLDAGMVRPSSALGVPGFTAYMGLLDISALKAGETVVVAAGAVGLGDGPIAKLKGCRVGGIAGGADKCRSAERELGLVDACIDHQSPDLNAQPAAACPQGIGVYFENVGSKVFNAPLLNTRARAHVRPGHPVQRKAALPNSSNRGPLLMRTLLTKRIRMKGFIIFDDYGHCYLEFAKDIGQWLTQGKIKFREDIVDGSENAPQAFIGLLEGKNFEQIDRSRRERLSLDRNFSPTSKEMT